MMSKRIPTGDSGPCELRLAEGWRGGPWEVGLLVVLLCRLQIRSPRRIKDVGSWLSWYEFRGALVFQRSLFSPLSCWPNSVI